jgi:hypothetical protein
MLSTVPKFDGVEVGCFRRVYDLTSEVGLFLEKGNFSLTVSSRLDESFAFCAYITEPIINIVTIALQTANHDVNEMLDIIVVNRKLRL